jgi:hypothetical protein
MPCVCRGKGPRKIWKAKSSSLTRSRAWSITKSARLAALHCTDAKKLFRCNRMKSKLLKLLTSNEAFGAPLRRAPCLRLCQSLECMLAAALNKHGLLGDAEDTQPFASPFLLVAGAMSGAPSHFAAARLGVASASVQMHRAVRRWHDGPGGGRECGVKESVPYTFR